MCVCVSVIFFYSFLFFVSFHFFFVGCILSKYWMRISNLVERERTMKRFCFFVCLFVFQSEHTVFGTIQRLGKERFNLLWMGRNYRLFFFVIYSQSSALKSLVLLMMLLCGKGECLHHISFFFMCVLSFINFIWIVDVVAVVVCCLLLFSY